MTTLTMSGGATDPDARQTAAGQPAKASQQRWVRPSYLLLLFGTALMYLWNLSSSGNANSYYAAAVQAGTKSWKAMFFGSSDASNFITVDKPPASLWVMELSSRIFGFNTWSMLVPQALEGVAAAALLYAAVRRWHGPVAALVAGATLALTPVAALMFRFNNPDALLTLLLVAAAYATVRALERANSGWLLLAGVFVGFGFLTKMLQAFLIIPALALVYLVTAPTSLSRRIVQLLGAGIAVVASAGWWVAIVELWPAGSRPYIGGSTNNSVLELAFGYNGWSRIFGRSGTGAMGGSAPGGADANAGFGGATGITRMFGDAFGSQISWLLPAALIALVVGLWLTRRAARTDRLRAAILLWGGWLVVNGLVFSYMKGTVHPYYAIALAPPIAALVAIVGRELWLCRNTSFARGALATIVATTGCWSYELLSRVPTWHPELRYITLILAALAAAALLLGVQRFRRLAVVVAGVTLVAGLTGPAAYAVQTAGTARSGAIPTAGPTDGGTSGAFGGGLPPMAGGTAIPGGAATGLAGADAGSSNSELVALLKASTTKWAAATSGAQSAAPLQLASGNPVMSMGGFTGTDAVPSLNQFQKYVKAGQIHYYIGSGMGGRPGGSSIGTSITTWVQSHYTAMTVGGETVYDLTKPVAS